MNPLNFVASLICAVAFGVATTNGATLYRLTDLGTLPGGRFSSAEDINNSGQIIGASAIADDTIRAFRWTLTNGMQNLGTLGGNYSAALGINNVGQIVGSSQLTNSASTERAFLRGTNGIMQNLGVLPGAGTSGASNVNNSGQVVGGSGDHAYSWTSSGGMKDIGTLPGGTTSYAVSINNSGQIVGTSTVAPNNYRAFLWTTAGGMQNLGTLGGNFSQADSVNDIGQVVGTSLIGSQNRAFLWTSGAGMVDLGTLQGNQESQASDINNLGEIVGFVPNFTVRDVAVYWDVAGTIHNLNELIDSSRGSWIFARAQAINDLGQIVGYGFSSSGSQHALLLTPVPEPPSLSLFLIAALVGVTVCICPLNELPIEKH